MPSDNKNTPLIVAGLSVFRDAQPCLRSCLDSFVHYVDGCLVLHGPGAEDDPNTPDDGTMQIVEECAQRFDPMNVKQAYYRKHPQRFMLLEMMREVTDAQGRSVQLISRQMRMQTLLAKILPGNFLFFIKPNELLVGNPRAIFEQIKTESTQDDELYYLKVISTKDAEEYEPRIVRSGAPGAKFDQEGELRIESGLFGRAIDEKLLKIYQFEKPSSV